MRVPDEDHPGNASVAINHISIITSADGLLVPDGIILLVISISALTLFNMHVID